MAPLGHHHDEEGRSAFRVFAPEKKRVAVVLLETGERVPLRCDAGGYWLGSVARLPEGSRYLLEVDGRCFPDPASRCQPDGVHGPSMVVEIEVAHSPGWAGVAMADAIVYELHLGSFTPEGTLVAARGKLTHLQQLGVTVIELLPLAAFPGERNWGYDGVYPFALHVAYGSHRDLKAFIEAAHEHGMAVILDIVCNHFGPEGNYSGAFAPYTNAAATPWGAAINFDGAHNHGVREFFLESVRHWLQGVGFDGLRMDAVSLIFDNMPQHILREFTDLARTIGQAQGREILMIAEHLRNNRHVTSAQGFHFHAQWSDDLNHALFAFLTGERAGHHADFGAFDDVVKAMRHGFVLDGSRFSRHHRYFLGTDGRLTGAAEHVVHIQNHDQVGNRLHGDRMIATHGRDKALLAITAVMASPFVPLLFMGEEYGETAPFFFFEDFADAALVEGVRQGRRADFAFGGAEPPDPHDRATFIASKLRWAALDTEEGRFMLSYYRQLVAMKRSGELGPRQRDEVTVSGDASTELITVQTRQTLTVMSFSSKPQTFDPPPDWQLVLASKPADVPTLPPLGAFIFRRGELKPKQKQPDLFGFEPRETVMSAPAKPSWRSSRDELFFALRPSADDALRIADSARSLKAEHGLTGTLLLPDRLHTTLHDLGSYQGLPPDLVAAAMQAAAGLSMAPFDMVFDRALSFATRQSKLPFVLCASDGAPAFAELHQSLGSALAKRGIKTKRHQTAHMTLLYASERIPEHPVDALRWRATEFVLIHSLAGRGIHKVLGRWPLEV